MIPERYAGQLCTKEAPDMGLHRRFDFKFRHASKEEMEAAVEVMEDRPEGFIAGWASTEMLDHVRDVVRPGAFDAAIKERGLDGPEGIKLLIQHDANRPAGKITKLEQRPQGLWIEAQLELEISYVKDMYLAAKMQGGLNFSIGYYLKEGGFRFIDLGDDSYWELTDIDLFEVSVVTFPCNDEAKMTFIKAREEGAPFDTISDFEKALVAAGVVKSRNAANAVTRWVKGLPLETATEAEPMSAAETKALNAASDSLAELRAAFQD